MNRMKRFAIIKNSVTWLVIWLVLIVSANLLFWNNLNPSIQFTWWVEIKTDVALDAQDINTVIVPKLQEIGYENPKITVSQSEGVSTMLIQVNVDNSEAVQKLSTIVNEYIWSKWQILEQSIIWASVWEYVKSSAIKAILAWLIFIAIYMMFTFSSVREMVSPLVLAIITVVTLLFDISIPAWAYWLLTAINPTTQVDLVFIAAILTIMWYSINDTIIIFDRVRENNKIHEWALKTGKMTYLKIFEDSLRQTMRRSLGTSLAAFIMVVMMWVFGTGIIKSFSYVIGMGIIAGTLSSIFIAAPLAYLSVRWTKGRK
jgi:preprotein translocase subunit SecF